VAAPPRGGFQAGYARALRNTAVTGLAAPPMNLQGLADWLLTTDPAQRGRLAQSGRAMVVMGSAVAAVHYFVAIGIATVPSVRAWTVVSLAGLAVAFLMIRTGWSRRWSDPSMTVAQMLFAITMAAWAYAMLGPARGAVFPIVMVIFMFGLFAAKPRQMAWTSLFAVVVFGLAMAVMAWRLPQVYPPKVELGHFIMVATMLPAASMLAARISLMRQRMRAQRVELKQALARIEELATCDALTGLLNRRHLLEVLERERQRSVRSGQAFCVAVLDLDGLRDVNRRHGIAAGDQVLCAFAQEAQAAVRIVDRLGRYGGGTFVLLLCDTRAPLGRLGVERMRERVAAMAVHAALGEAVRITISAGLTEHHAGETIDEALSRAQLALREAKALGRNRMVVG
jgi:diguanylate cyclase (GGDEF)-like protein